MDAGLAIDSAPPRGEHNHAAATARHKRPPPSKSLTGAMVRRKAGASHI
jgi:hypothetical protein